MAEKEWNPIKITVTPVQLTEAQVNNGVTGPVAYLAEGNQGSRLVKTFRCSTQLGAIKAALYLLRSAGQSQTYEGTVIND